MRGFQSPFICCCFVFFILGHWCPKRSHGETQPANLETELTHTLLSPGKCFMLCLNLVSKVWHWPGLDLNHQQSVDWPWALGSPAWWLLPSIFIFLFPHTGLQVTSVRAGLEPSTSGFKVSSLNTLSWILSSLHLTPCSCVFIFQWTRLQSRTQSGDCSVRPETHWNWELVYRRTHGTELKLTTLAHRRVILVSPVFVTVATPVSSPPVLTHSLFRSGLSLQIIHPILAPVCDPHDAAARFVTGSQRYELNTPVLATFTDCL